jgi:hypothetical protein
VEYAHTFRKLFTDPFVSEFFSAMVIFLLGYPQIMIAVDVVGVKADCGFMAGDYYGHKDLA